MHNNVRFRREVLGYDIQNPQVIESVDPPEVLKPEVTKHRDLVLQEVSEPTIIATEDLIKPVEPEIGNLSGLMAKMEGKIQGGRSHTTPWTS